MLLDLSVLNFIFLKLFMFTAPDTITTENAHLVLQVGLEAISKGQIEFDFATTRKTDSAAVAMLLDWQREAKVRGVVLKFLNLPASLKSLAQLYDVAGLLSIPA